MKSSLHSPCARSWAVAIVSSLLALPASCLAQASLDTTYAPTLNKPVDALGIQADGKLVTGYTYQSYSLASDMFRFNVNGSNDGTFAYVGNTLLTGNNGDVSAVRSVSCFMDGTVAISGAFDTVNSGYVPKIFKSNEAGKKVAYAAPEVLNDGSPVAPLGWVVWPSIVALPDNSAFVYGDFTSMAWNGTRMGIARLSGTGALVKTFAAVPGTTSTASTKDLDHQVNCVVQQPDGKVLVGGEFNRFNNTASAYLVRVSPTGVLDAGFTANPNGFCHAIALQADGKILVSGFFSSIGGGFRSYLARLNIDGTLDTSFICTVSGGNVWSIVPRADGKIVIGGGFSLVNGSSIGRYALLNSDGSLAADYASLGANGTVAAVAIQNDGKLLLGGYFTSIGSSSRPYVARLTADVAAVNTLSIDAEGTTIDWVRDGSAPEIENAEFRLSTDNVTFGTVLGKGVRVAGGWRLSGLKLPGNKTFYIQAKGLSRGGFYNGCTSVMKSVQNFLRPLPNIDTQPAARTVVLGDTGVSFSIAASSAAAMTYQWKRNGTAISGATATTYTIPGGVTTGAAGTYTCTITSSAGAVTSAGALLTVVTPITITKQPVFQAVLPDKPATFTVTVTGSSPQYQWIKGTTDIPGATAATYKITAASAITHEDNYSVRVSNFAGAVVSVAVRLYVLEAGTSITVPPPHAILALGSPPYTLNATVVSESPPLYQWLKNNASIAGATSSSLTLNSITLAAAGRYALRTSNPAGSSTSNPATEIAVVDRLATKHFVIAQGSGAVLTAIAAGNGLTFHWKKGGSYLADTGLGVLPSIAGSGTKTLTLKGLTTNETDSYTCEVTAPGGSLDSAVQRVIVTTGRPVIDSSFDLPPAMVGADYDYTVPVNTSAELTPNKFEASGLPTGLKIDTFTGRITGRPTAANTVTKNYSVTIKASNSSDKVAASASDTLEVQAVPGTLVGSFLGVIPPDRNSATFRNGGRLTLTVTTVGGYSGSVMLGTSSYSFTGGRLNAGVGFNRSNTISVPRKGLASLTLQFDLDATTQLITGSITEGAVTEPLSGWRQSWSATNKALSFKGYYTMALTAPPSAPGDLSYPLGDGYATFTVGELGTLTITGKLADGTGFSTSGYVGPTGQLAVYSSPYGTTGGAVWGVGSAITAAGSAPDYKESFISGSVGVVKYQQTTGHTYAAGFGPLSLTCMGARYATSNPGSNVVGADTLTNDVQLNYTGARVELATQNPSILVRLTDKNVFVLPTFASGNNPASTSISFTASTGLITATSFTVSEDVDPGPVVKTVKRTAKGAGVVVRNIITGAGGGFGYFTLLQSPGDAASDTLSGRLRVTIAP